MTGGQQLREEGRQLGRQEGVELGRQEGVELGQRAMLLRLLRAKFGQLSPEDVARVETADLELLESWAENILSAATLADVFGRQ